MPGNTDDARGLGIKAMDDTGPPGFTAQFQTITPQKSIDQGALGMANRRMHNHASGFIDDDKIIIFVENLQGDIFWFDFAQFDFGKFQGKGFTATEFVAGLGLTGFNNAAP